MGLRQRLATLAASSAHVLVVEAPGAWRVRAEVQRALAARGWQEALSPADADALVVCGAPGEQLAGVVERVWEQLPGPRARAGVVRVEDVPAVLDEVAAALTDLTGQREDAKGRSLRPDLGDGDEDHGDMDHGDMDHGDMDHGDMEMEPGGVPLASGAEDRDGLEMDVLQVRLGPVLPAWPAGLVLDCTLAGDVVTAAEVQVLPAADAAVTDREQEEPDPPVDAARLCDHASDVLVLAGWADGAVRARAVRDGLLAGTAGASEVRDVQRRVERSRVLRWSLRPLRLPQPLAGEVHARLVSLLDHAAWCLDHAPDRCETARPALGEVPSLVTGLELATARLVVAALALDPARQQVEEEAEVGADA